MLTMSIPLPITACFLADPRSLSGQQGSDPLGSEVYKQRFGSAQQMFKHLIF